MTIYNDETLEEIANFSSNLKEQRLAQIALNQRQITRALIDKLYKVKRLLEDIAEQGLSHMCAMEGFVPRQREDGSFCPPGPGCGCDDCDTDMEGRIVNLLEELEEKDGLQT